LFCLPSCPHSGNQIFSLNVHCLTCFQLQLPIFKHHHPNCSFQRNPPVSNQIHPFPTPTTHFQAPPSKTARFQPNQHVSNQIHLFPTPTTHLNHHCPFSITNICFQRKSHDFALDKDLTYSGQVIYAGCCGLLA
jgi:hypothetical protein